jgi:N-acetylglucosamine-6-sulfatase
MYPYRVSDSEAFCPSGKIGCVPVPTLRATFLCGLWALLTFIVLGCGSGESSRKPEAASQDKPNIIFVLTDDMRKDEFSRIEGLRALAAEGVTFENAFVTNPECCPSRVTDLTGKYSHNHGVLTNEGSLHGGYDAYRKGGVGRSTVATWLQEAGYRTGLFGKFLNGYASKDKPNGFDTYVRTSSPADDPALGAKAADFIENNYQKGPLFIALWVKSPHTPLEVNWRFLQTHRGETFEQPPSFNEEDVSDKAGWVRVLPPFNAIETAHIMEAREERLRMLEGANFALRKTLGALQSVGERDNTYIVFTSDNGFMLGEHRLAFLKTVPYEESTHVPLVITGPDVPQGKVRDELVANNDLAPTMAAWAGVDAPSVDGRSLAPLLSDEAVSWRNALLTENPGGVTGRYGRVPGHAALVTRSFVYIEWGTGDRELYDLREDPYETRNVYSRADTAIVESLEDRLAALEMCSGKGCRDAEDTPAPKRVP